MGNNSTYKGNVIYIGHIGEDGTAMALHTRNIACLLENLGYKVTFVCKNVRQPEKQYGKLDQFEYHYTNQYLKLPKIRTIEWMIEEVAALKLMRLFKKINSIKRASFVIFYGYSGEKHIINYCHRHGIKVVIDRTDWFEPDDSDNAFGRLFTKFIANKCVEKHDFLADGVISISRFFENHYKNGGQQTIFIPPLMQNIVLAQDISPADLPIRLVYAGSLGGNKDSIEPVIECLINSFNREDVQFKLSLVGIDERQLNKSFGEHDWRKFGIYAFGKISHTEAESIVANSDFSFLLRQNKRYAKAGFSTKFAESLSMGVPVICTCVGGADQMITDMENGVLVQDNSIQSIQSALKKVLTLSEEQRNQMKLEAQTLAMNAFHPDLYKQTLASFLLQDEKKERKNDLL